MEASQKMLKLAKTLAKELKEPLPESKSFEDIQKFIQYSLQKLKERRSQGIGLCPVCGEKVVERRLSYFCNCGLTIWKETRGIKITEDMARRLLQCEKVTATYKTRQGKKISVQLYLNNKKVELSFNN